jgi:DNA-binding transcriptional ArsR family regulator
MAKYRNNMDLVTDWCSALGDANRVRILAALLEGELCVCRLIGLLDLAPSTVSKHLQILKHTGFVQSRKQGRWIHYRLSGDMENDCALLVNWLRGALKNDATIQNDKKELKRLMKEAAEDICQMNKKK